MGTYDEWKAAKARLDTARERISKLLEPIRDMSSKLDSDRRLLPGGKTMSPPIVAGWPTAEQITEAAAEFRTALLMENQAYNALPPEDQKNIKRHVGDLKPE